MLRAGLDAAVPGHFVQLLSPWEISQVKFATKFRRKKKNPTPKIFPHSTDRSGTECQKRAEHPTGTQSASPDRYSLPSSPQHRLSATLLHWGRTCIVPESNCTSVLLLELIPLWTSCSLPTQQGNACDSVLVQFSGGGHFIVSNTFLSQLYRVSTCWKALLSLICKQGQKVKD